MGRPPNSNTKKTLVKPASGSDSASPKFDDVPIEPLSGKPFWGFILSEPKHLSRMVFPTKLNSALPNGKVPAVITYGKKTWRTTLHGGKTRKSLDYKTWSVDSKLRLGDGLILEVMESSQDLVEFKAQILRGDFPTELEAKMGGGTPETAIIID